MFIYLFMFLFNVCHSTPYMYLVHLHTFQVYTTAPSTQQAFFRGPINRNKSSARGRPRQIYQHLTRHMIFCWAKE